MPTFDNLFVKLCALSIINHVAEIVPKPPDDILRSIESSISRLINSGSYYKSTKTLVFTDKKFRGLGIPNIKQQVEAI